MRFLTDARIDQALILIFCAERIIRERRDLEKKCDYPASYGSDENLLKRMSEYLDDKSVKAEIIRISNERGYGEIFDAAGT